ncbi:MAG: biotin synthase BioB [Candidatus Margulisiibacteriota bacterium]
MIDYQELANDIIKGKTVSDTVAFKLINTSDEKLFELLAAAHKIRRHFKGNRIRLCAIINAKSGRCSENCIFCAQSAHYQTKINTYPLVGKDTIVDAANQAQKMSATCFSIVTSGKSIHNQEEVSTIAFALKTIASQTKMNRCVSLGTISKESIKILKDSGLKRLHHNLETAESFFAKICTTHTYQERIETIKSAKEAGLEVCSGGIFGLGETPEQRVELAFTLKQLNVDSVPINILHPIAGTPAEKNYKPLSPFEILKLIATYRFILPDKDIGVFGGREYALRDLQAFIFPAGANAILIGDYLTTKGQPPEKDLQMIHDLGLEPEKVEIDHLNV